MIKYLRNCFALYPCTDTAVYTTVCYVCVCGGASHSIQKHLIGEIGEHTMYICHGVENLLALLSSMIRKCKSEEPAAPELLYINSNMKTKIVFVVSISNVYPFTFSFCSCNIFHE